MLLPAALPWADILANSQLIAIGMPAALDIAIGLIYQHGGWWWRPQKSHHYMMIMTLFKINLPLPVWERINSLDPGRCSGNLKWVIFKLLSRTDTLNICYEIIAHRWWDSKNGIFNLVLLIDIFRSSHDNALRWMSQDLTDDQSTLVQVMAWCRQATSHYLSQCWLRSLSPYGVARPQ